MLEGGGCPDLRIWGHKDKRRKKKTKKHQKKKQTNKQTDKTKKEKQKKKRKESGDRPPSHKAPSLSSLSPSSPTAKSERCDAGWDATGTATALVNCGPCILNSHSAGRAPHILRGSVGGGHVPKATGPPGGDAVQEALVRGWTGPHASPPSPSEDRMALPRGAGR